MPILAAYIVPHPPLIIPEIGKGEQLKILNTINAYEEISRKIADFAPDTIIFITPHSVSYSDYIHISPGLTAEGDFGSFGAKDVSFGVMYEKKLVEDVTRICDENGVAAGNLGGDGKSARLDHGVMVPLYFINKYFQDYRCVRASISGLSFEEHYRFGQILDSVCENFYRNTVIIASGDLSHKLKPEGPYGFSPAGPVFDEKIQNIVKSADFGGLLSFSARECQRAAECGLRSFIIMAGMLDNKSVKSELLSYEGPFGVGYAVGEFIVTGENRARSFLGKEMNSMYLPESDYTRLAKQSLESYINDGKKISVPKDVNEELLTNSAGVFVSLKKNGELRGCIGTIAPTRENIAEEIIANAISAGTTDPRFPKVTEDELADIVYSVDVLGEAERISDKSELDVMEYGVIVTKGWRRGLLLPNLEGVDTIEEQILIALQKAGISPYEDYEMERFKVVRYK